MEGSPSHDIIFEEPGEGYQGALGDVLKDINSLALDHDLGIITANPSTAESELPADLTGEALDDSIADLSASTVRDMQEFERLQGFKDGLVAVAALVAKRQE